MPSSDDESDNDKSTLKVKKLVGANNYRTWAQEAELILEYKDVWDIVNGDYKQPDALTGTPSQDVQNEYDKKLAKFKRKNIKASIILWKMISEDIRGDVEEFRKQPKKLWDELRKLFNTQQVTTTSTIASEIRSMRYDLSQDVDKFYARLKHLRTQLIELNAPIPAHDLNDIVIKSIKDSGSVELEAFRFTLRGKYKLDSDFRLIIQDIKDFVTQIKQEHLEAERIEKVLYTRSQGQGQSNNNNRRFNNQGGQGSNGGRKPPKFCTHCDRIGHVNDNCFRLHPELKDKYEVDRARRLAAENKRDHSSFLKDNDDEKADKLNVTSGNVDKDNKKQKSKVLDSLPKKTRTYMAIIKELSDDDLSAQEEKVFVVNSNPNHHKSLLEWNIDSCASMHVGCNVQYFESIRPCDKKYLVVVGNGNGITPAGMGTVRFTTVVDSQPTITRLTNVLYVPSFMANLISVGELAKKGLGTSFDPMTSNGACKGYVFDGIDNEIIMTCSLRKQIYVLDQVYEHSFKVMAQMSRVMNDDVAPFFKAKEFDTSDSEFSDRDFRTYTAQVELREPSEFHESFNVEKLMDMSDEEEKIFNVEVEVVNEDDMEVDGTGEPKGNLNEEDDDTGSDSSTEIPSEVTTKSTTVDIHNHVWHCRLGHPHHSIMRTIGHVNNIPKLEKSKGMVCHGCLAGKGTKKSRTAKRNNREVSFPQGLFEIIHADTCGPITPESIQTKFRYFQLYMDGKSSYTTVAFIRTKAEGLENVETYIQVHEGLADDKIQRFKSDNGTEFCNTRLQKFFAKKGIIHEKSAPYTPSQNGRIERRIREVLRKAKCFMAVAGAPPGFWKFAVEFATYIVNRLPTPVNPNRQSPYEMVNGFSPDISRIRVWGCTAFVFVPKEKRKKLDHNVAKCALLGIEGDNGNYILWDPKAKKVIVSDDVLFDEFDFSIFDRTDRKAIGVIRHKTTGEYPDSYFQDFHVNWR